MTQTESDQTPTRVLLVLPASKSSNKLHRMISSLELQPEVLWVHSLAQALKALSESFFNLVLLQFETEETPINQIIDQLLSHAPGIPLVLNAVESQEAEAQKLLKRGLMDYFITPRDCTKATLERILRYAITQQLNEEEITKLTQYDRLTGVANRFLFRDRLSQAVIRAQRSGKTLAVLIIDLDQFHAYNNEKGYQLGDILLKEVSKRIVNSVRRQDTVARLSGDEFAVVLEGLNDPQDAGIIAKEMTEQFSTPLVIEGEPHQATLSLGVAVSSPNILDPETLTKQADIARYRVKENGGNSFEFFNVQDNAEYQTRNLATKDLSSTLNRIFSTDE